MILKRFRYGIIEGDGEYSYIFDKVMNKLYLVWNTEHSKNLCELLNELYDENNALEQRLTTKHTVNEQYEELQKVKKANEQLRLENSRLMKKIGEYSRKVKELEKEEEGKSCGTCKYFQLDGMFGTWCDLGKDWTNVEYCSDWER